MNEKKPAVKVPGVAEFLSILGVFSIIGGILAFISAFVILQGSFSDNPAPYFVIGVSALTTGGVLIGLSAGLALLTKIANYLALLAPQDEPSKPASIKEVRPLGKAEDGKPPIYKI